MDNNIVYCFAPSKGIYFDSAWQYMNSYSAHIINNKIFRHVSDDQRSTLHLVWK